jgi:N-acetylglucosaminyldiphosphoundecaprenol N-acetyl-beta-D-mannosaminyltransferase
MSPDRGWLDEGSSPGRGVTIGDLRFDALDLAQTVAVIERALARGTRGYVVTPNVDHVVQYCRNPAYRAVCDAAALRLADGMPIVWASRLLGRPLPARVAGSDLLPALCQTAAARGYTVFLLGGAAGVPERAATRLRTRFPGLRIAGLHAPPDRFAPDAGAAAAAAVAAVNAVKPALLFVGLGAPKQELWVHRYWQRLDATVAVCCGAAIDYAAGARIRAPLWMQRAGLEWVWRLSREPGRLWRRYLVQDAAFLGIFLKEWWSVRSQAFNKR